MDKFKDIAQRDPRFEAFYKSIQEDIGIIVIASRNVHMNQVVIDAILRPSIERQWARYKKGASIQRIREDLYGRVIHRLISQYISELIAVKNSIDNEKKT